MEQREAEKDDSWDGDDGAQIPAAAVVSERNEEDNRHDEAVAEEEDNIIKNAAKQPKKKARGKPGKANNKPRKKDPTTTEDNKKIEEEKEEQPESKPLRTHRRTRSSSVVYTEPELEEEAPSEGTAVGLPRLRRLRSKMALVLESVNEEASLAAPVSVTKSLGDRDSKAAEVPEEEQDFEEEIEEKPKKRSVKRRTKADRAPLKSVSSNEEEKEDQGGEPEPAAIGASKGRKRRLLQPAKPLSAPMRSALGELALAELQLSGVAAVGIGPSMMPPHKTPGKGAGSMGEILGLTPARRNCSPKRTRRSTAAQQIQDLQ